MLISYGEYLEKQDDEIQKEAISELEEVATGEDSWFVRMAAVNSLIKMNRAKKEEVNKLAERIANETEAEEKERLTKQKAAAEEMTGKVTEALMEINEQEENKNLKRLIEGELN